MQRKLIMFEGKPSYSEVEIFETTKMKIQSFFNFNAFGLYFILFYVQFLVQNKLFLVCKFNCGLWMLLKVSEYEIRKALWFQD
jgi:hypothetical protein